MTDDVLIYLVGGPMRTGKSQAARLFNARTGISYVSTDHLRHMLGRAGAPQLGIGGDQGNTWQENRRRLAPFLSPLVEARVRPKDALLIEGELPVEFVAAASAAHPGLVRACFIGAAGLSVEAKVAALKAWSEQHGDWLAGEPDSLFEWAARESLSASIEYRDAASKLGIPYFDLSSEFEAGLERVVAYLVSGATR